MVKVWLDTNDIGFHVAKLMTEGKVISTIELLTGNGYTKNGEPIDAIRIHTYTGVVIDITADENGKLRMEVNQ